MTEYTNFIEALGIRFTEVGKDRIVAEMETGPQHTNGSNIVHGGVYMAFADTLGARGTIMNLPEGTRTSTLESKTNFLRGTAPGTLVGESTPIHVGRSEEHTSELQSLMRISYAVFCLKNNTQ